MKSFSFFYDNKIKTVVKRKMRSKFSPKKNQHMIKRRKNTNIDKIKNYLLFLLITIKMSMNKMNTGI